MILSLSLESRTSYLFSSSWGVADLRFPSVMLSGKYRTQSPRPFLSINRTNRAWPRTTFFSRSSLMWSDRRTFRSDDMTFEVPRESWQSEEIHQPIKLMSSTSIRRFFKCFRLTHFVNEIHYRLNSRDFGDLYTATAFPLWVTYSSNTNPIFHMKT